MIEKLMKFLRSEDIDIFIGGYSNHDPNFGTSLSTIGIKVPEYDPNARSFSSDVYPEVLAADLLDMPKFLGSREKGSCLIALSRLSLGI